MNENVGWTRGNIDCQKVYLMFSISYLLRNKPRWVLSNFQYGGVRANISVRKFTLNQYLGSVNYNKDKNSILGVNKSEERKNRGICLAVTSHGMQCYPEIANHEINVLLLKTSKGQAAQIEIIEKHYRRVPELSRIR